MIKNVIFDLDGTLLNTSRGIGESIRYTINQMKLRNLSEEEILSFIGPPLKKMFIAQCGCTVEEAQMATTVFRAHYQNESILHAEAYPGIKNLCEILDNNGIRMGVATNKPQRFADLLMKEFGLEQYFDPVCGANEKGTLSKADLIRCCMNTMGATKEETVMVGDTDNDALGAAKAGVPFLAVTYGFGFKKPSDLMNYEHIGAAETPMDIISFIL